VGRRKRNASDIPLDLVDSNPEIIGEALLCPSCRSHIYYNDLLEKVAFAEEKKAFIICDMCGKKINYTIKTSFNNESREMIITIKKK